MEQSFTFDHAGKACRGGCCLTNAKRSSSPYPAFRSSSEKATPLGESGGAAGFVVRSGVERRLPVEVAGTEAFIRSTRRLRTSSANIGPKRVHQNRTVSWLIPIPRSCSRSSTSRSDSGNRMYGTHRLICGDARNPEVLAKLLGGDEVGMIFTDPPYNVKVDGHVGALAG